MSSKLKEWQLRLAERINKQEGQNYPCSNQVVVNGFFGRKIFWNKFIKENKKDIIKYYNSRFDYPYALLKNGEKWIYFEHPMKARGYRFYKAKIDSSLSREYVLENIMPYCGYYCSELEWLY